MPGEAPSGREKQQPSKPTSCVGALWFSQSRYDRQKAPVCAGVRRTHEPKYGAAELPSEAIPGGDFKYLCVGYSAYDPAKLKAAAAQRSSQSDGVNVPYCEGLEIISAAAMTRKPELLTEGPGVGEASPSGPESGARPQRPPRNFVPGGLPGGADMQQGMDWDRFRERFWRMSQRMLDKMASNAAYMAVVAKRSWQQLSKDSAERGRD